MKNITADIYEPAPHCKAARVFLLLVACWLTGCAGGVKDTSRSFNRVVIDAGHGGHDNGTTSRYAGREKDGTLEVAMRLKPKLEAAGFSTVMTRRDDTFIELDERARISNRQSNALFVSIHFNDSPNSSAHGTEVYYNSRVSTRTAQNILNQITSLPGTVDRGVKFANFRVLRKNEYPAVLVECGYFSNPGEGRRCASGDYREALASAIARGVVIQRHGSSSQMLAAVE